MSTVAESPLPEEKPHQQPPGDIFSTINPKTLETTQWIDSTTQQLRIYLKAIEEKLDSTTTAISSRFTRIRSTSSAHFSQTIDSLKDFKSEFNVYEDKLFGVIKEGVVIAVSHPLISSAVAAGTGLVLFKKPRRFLYYSSLRLLLSEESLLSRADAKVKRLQQSIDVLKVESEKLEKITSSGEEEFLRGRTKLRQAGKQIHGVIRSAYKIEKQAAGLRDALRELPSRQASRFRTQVSSLASEAKKEKNNLSKEVTKISNYGISV